MTTGHTDRPDQPDRDQLVEEYLQELEREAARLPWNARQELLEDVRSHIEVALAETDAADGESTAGVRRILEALGEPREIVDAAVVEEPTSPQGAFPPPQYGQPFSPYGSPYQYSTDAQAAPPFPLGPQEMFAIGLLLIGGFIFIVGWFVGLLLLWTSPRWKLRERLIGTFVVPGGLAGALVLPTLSTKEESCIGDYADATQHCTSHGWSFPAWIGIPLFLLCLAAPFVTAFYLAHCARLRPGLNTGPSRMGGVLVGMVIGVAAFVAVGGVACTAFSSGGSKQQPATPAPVYSTQVATVSASGAP